MAKTEKKPAVRRTVLKVCEDFNIQLLQTQLRCMKNNEPGLAAACAEMITTMADAIKLRQINRAAAEDVETADSYPDSDGGL